ncbi:MAG: hypothetical protein Q9169_002873 [Polycauliona sp. 2 TL-2023]
MEFEPSNTLSGTPMPEATPDVPKPKSRSTTYFDEPVNTDDFFDNPSTDHHTFTDDFFDDFETDPHTTSGFFEDDDDINTPGLAGRTTSVIAESGRPNDGVTSSLAQASSIPLPPGATVMSRTIGGVVVTQTFIPTRISQYASLLSTTSFTTVDAQNSAFTYLVGPGGVAWTPLSPPNAGPQIQPTNAPFRSTTRTFTDAAIRAPTTTIASAGSTPSQGSATRTIPDPAITDGALPIISTPVDAQAATLTSVDSTITENTAISTGDGSNIGAATYNPATWCGCNDGGIYSTIPEATSDYCAYSTAPSSTIRPSQVPNPYPFTSTNMQNGEVVACATSSVDTASSSTICQGSSTVVSTVTSIAEAARPTADCEFWDQVLFWSFEIYNINGWAGEGGDALKTQEKGCGGLTGWEWHVDDERYQRAYFNLPFTIKEGCVERAIRSAGGPEGLSCQGHGLKKRVEPQTVQKPSIQPHQRLRSKKYGKRSDLRFTHGYLYLDEKSSQAANPNISSRSLVPRAEHGEAWNKYAPKGIQYYNEWKNRPADQDDKADLCNFDKTYDFSQDPLSVTGPYDAIKPYISGAKGQTYTNFRWHWPKGPTSTATAIFWNNISPVDNVIIAFSNDRGGDEEEGEDPSPDNWSDMLWWLWLRATSESGDKSALSQIFRYNVDNESSKEILEEILGDKEDEVVTLEADDAQSQENGFWALLGCPNGTGMIHMVGDHKKALGEKGIKSISCIYNRREDQYYMWGNLG